MIQKMSPTEITSKQFKKLMKSPFRTKVNYNCVTEPNEDLQIQEQDDKCHLTVNLNNKFSYDSPTRKNRTLKQATTLEKVTLGPNSASQFESKTGLFKGLSPSLKAITHLNNGDNESNLPEGITSVRKFEPIAETPEQFIAVVTKRYQKESFDPIKSPHASSYLTRVDKIREETAKTQMEQVHIETQAPKIFKPQISMNDRRLASHASLNKHTGIDGNTLVISPSRNSKKSPSTLSHGSF